MILAPCGRILAETWKAGDDIVVADLDASLLEVSTGSRRIVTRRPELHEPLTVPTGLEQDTRTARFNKKGVSRPKSALSEPDIRPRSCLTTALECVILEANNQKACSYWELAGQGEAIFRIDPLK